MATSKGRRIVDAIDEVVAELRLANRIEVLRMPAAALEDDKGERNKTEAAKARTARMNKIRAEIRAGLGIEGEQGS